MKVPKRFFLGLLDCEENGEIDKVTDERMRVGCYKTQLPAHRPTVGAEIAGDTGAKAMPHSKVPRLGIRNGRALGPQSH